MSHFLNPDSDKKKSALTSTFPELFFCAAATRAFPQRQSLGEATQSAGAPPPRGMIVPLLRSSFSFWASFPHACAWGFLVLCRASGARSPRRAKRGNGARGSDARGFLFAYPYFRYAPRGNAADSFSANEKSVPAGTLFAFGEKEDYFFFFPVDLKSFFTDATA